jgi:spermidine/putrescine-binding protein
MSNKLTASLLTAALSAGLMISLNSSAALAQQATLVVSNFAIAQDLMRKDLYAPFEAKCNCKIVVDAGNAADRLAKLEARKGNPEADIAVLADFTALEAARKDLIPANYRTSTSSTILPKIRSAKITALVIRFMPPASSIAKIRSMSHPGQTSGHPS